MLAAKYGLKGKKNFQKVEEEGEISQSESFGLAYRKRGDANMSLYGFIVSNKISNESTLRNRIKRALKEAVRHSLGEIKPGYDVVFLTKQRALKTSTENLMREVKESLKNAGLFK